jgi:aspartate carbamoyltransferase catalytic subunit
MHPGPMNRGVEIAAQVADSPRSTIVEQVANGVSVRMAVLYLLLGGAIGTGAGETGDGSSRPAERPAEVA